MTTIALNIMATTGEQEILVRAVESAVALLAVDEIKILIPPGDPLLASCCSMLHDKYGAEWIEYIWINDFGGARNTLLKETKSDFVLWMDVDDVLAGDNWKNFRENVIAKVPRDFYSVMYRLFDEHQKLHILTTRDKIFRNSGAQWIKKVHETIEFDHPASLIGLTDVFIEHRPIKNTMISLKRNIDICTKEMQEENDFTLHYKYFYLRDMWSLMSFGMYQEFEESVLEDMKVWVDDKIGIPAQVVEFGAIIGATLVNRYQQAKPEDRKLINLEKAELYLRIALSFCQTNPLIYCCLAEIYIAKNLIEEAIILAKKALSLSDVHQPHNIQSIVPVVYYRQIPAYILSQIYIQIGQPELFLQYNRMYIQNGGNPRAIDARIEVLTKLLEDSLVLKNL